MFRYGSIYYFIDPNNDTRLKKKTQYGFGGVKLKLCKLDS